MLRLYRERYTGFNVRHFHHIARREHGVTVSRSFDVSRFASGIRAIAQHAPPGTDTERHRSAVETGTPTGIVPGGG